MNCQQTLVLALPDFAALLYNNGIKLHTEQKKSSLAALSYLNSMSLLSSNTIDNSKPHLFLRLFVDVHNRQLKSLYSQENKARIIVAVDFVEGVNNPFPLLKGIRDSVNAGSKLILFNKHIGQPHRQIKYGGENETCHFLMKKTKDKWQVMLFNSASCRETSTDQFTYNPRLSYFKSAAKSAEGPTPDILEANNYIGPYADWYRLPTGENHIQIQSIMCSQTG